MVDRAELRAVTGCRTN